MPKNDIKWAVKIIIIIIIITLQITTPIERAKIAISHRGHNGESNPVRKKKRIEEKILRLKKIINENNNTNSTKDHQVAQRPGKKKDKKSRLID